MSEDDRDAIRESVIESFEQSAEVYGLSRSAGRVYGVLYFADDPLSIPELVEETGYAKSTISNVTRTLARIGLIHRRSSGGGGRRVEFAPETNVWFVVQDVFQQYVHREVQTSQRTLIRARRELSDLDGDETRRDQERIDDLTATYEQIQQLLELTIDHSPEELIEAVEQYDRDQE